MLIYNAQLYTMSDGVILKGWLKTENGIITGLGEMDECPPVSDSDMDAVGAPLTPGLIDAHCHIGLMEDSQSFDETDDANEWSDPVTPHLRGLDSVNPLDRMFREALPGGVTAVCVGPGSGNPIGGQMTVLKTMGRRVDDMVITETAALKAAFGENPRLHGKKDKPPYTRMGTAALIRGAFLSALEYKRKLESGDKPDFNIKWESLIPVLDGKVPVHAHAHRACDIFTALRIGREFGLDIVVVHGTEGGLVSDLLEGVSVITGPSFGTRSKPELRSLSLETPGVLSAAGLRPCICTDAPVLPIDSLALMAGLAVKAGMKPYEALRAVTLYPAQTLRLDNRIGALRVGLDADLVLWNDHPLLADASPSAVLINGAVQYRV